MRFHRPTTASPSKIGAMSAMLRRALISWRPPTVASVSLERYAGRWFDQIAADRETPPALRQRLAIYTALVAGGPVQVTQ